MSRKNSQAVGVVLLAVLVCAGVWVYTRPHNTSNAEGNTEVARFSMEMRNKVVAEIGQPIEGFEPFMFMQMYPGLTPQDFNEVDALIGVYRSQDGQIVYDPNGAQELHTAARAISDGGMAQLYHNILARVSLMSGADPVLGVIAAISAE